MYVIHGKNGFAQVSKNLARSENNIVWIIRVIMWNVRALMIMLQKVLSFQ